MPLAVDGSFNDRHPDGQRGDHQRGDAGFGALLGPGHQPIAARPQQQPRKQQHAHFPAAEAEVFARDARPDQQDGCGSNHAHQRHRKGREPRALAHGDADGQIGAAPHDIHDDEVNKTCRGDRFGLIDFLRLDTHRFSMQLF
jgi:hypothetical protein